MTLISSDLFNPMLVRDLRQGLRSSRFTFVFLSLQGGMAFFVAMGLLSGSGSSVAQALEQTLIIGLLLFYLLGLPMAATFALSAEFHDNRIDLLKLTQMSARSLIWGKWISLVMQGLMVFTSLLPYLILTYFFGSWDWQSALLAIVSLLAFSVLLVALCVALSCVNSMLFRILLILGLLGLTMLAIQLVNGTNLGAWEPPVRALITSVKNDPGIAASLYIAIGLPFLFLVMEFGAHFLSPAAENHDTPQRLILCGLIALAGLTMVFDMWYPGSFVDTFTDRFFFFTALMGVWMLMFAAATNPSPYPDTYRAFARFGLPGKFIGRAFLYPGWPSSAPFIMLVAAFCAMLAVAWASLRLPSGANLDYNWFYMTFMLLPPALLFPQVAGWLILGRSRISAGTRYFLVMALSFLFYVFCALLANATAEPKILLYASVFPPSAWILFAFHQLDGLPGLPFQGTAQIIAGISSILTMVVVVVRTLRVWGNFTKLEQMARSASQVKRARAATKSVTEVVGSTASTGAPVSPLGAPVRSQPTFRAKAPKQE
ncbi:MAG TPA: hypothetical protein VK737_08415 [Opitutales bacterium]|jgi:hypothetical protein|nr:hypothetical protein [Opitutales bacterium]